MGQALNSARGKARAIKCTGNLKQMGAAYFLYNSDYENPLNYKVVLISSRGNIGSGWFDKLAVYAGFVFPEAPTIGSDLTFALNNKKSIFICPEIRRPSEQTNYRLPSYKMNKHEFFKERHYIDSTACKYTSRTIIFIDGDYLPIDPWRGVSCWNHNVWVPAQGIHKGNNNIMCYDGHVEALKTVFVSSISRMGNPSSYYRDYWY